MKERTTYLITIGTLIIALLFAFNSCSNKDKELQVSRQNTQALLEKTKQTENSLGQLQFERASFMGDIETLKRLNHDLVKEIDAQKGNVRVVTKVVTKVVFDTVIINNKVDRINDSTFVINFEHSRAFDSANSVGFKGKVPALLSTIEGKPSITSQTTTIYDMKLDMKLYTGIREQDGIYSIFARTDFPGVKFDLDGAIVDPEKSFIDKKTSPFSIMLGGGLGYGITPSGNGVFPSVGVYVGINLFNF